MPSQTIEKWRSAALLRKVRILTYGAYASALNFSRALHLTIFEQSANLDFLNSQLALCVLIAT
jgi:hypothetical protein